MCTGFEIAALALGGLGLGSQLLAQPDKPPTPEIPATPAPASKTPGAIVRVGANAGKTDNTQANYVGFAEKRKSGKALGGLGRGGLTI